MFGVETFLIITLTQVAILSENNVSQMVKVTLDFIFSPPDPSAWFSLYLHAFGATN